ncbi:MAG: hypothetical protein Kow0031_08040 [Anaerolineae bacterium]
MNEVFWPKFKGSKGERRGKHPGHAVKRDLGASSPLEPQKIFVRLAQAAEATERRSIRRTALTGALLPLTRGECVLRSLLARTTAQRSQIPPPASAPGQKEKI